MVSNVEENVSKIFYIQIQLCRLMRPRTLVARHICWHLYVSLIRQTSVLQVTSRKKNRSHLGFGVKSVEDEVVSMVNYTTRRYLKETHISRQLWKAMDAQNECLVPATQVCCPGGKCVCSGN
jgi:hypothetical protein